MRKSKRRTSFGRKSRHALQNARNSPSQECRALDAALTHGRDGRQIQVEVGRATVRAFSSNENQAPWLLIEYVFHKCRRSLAAPRRSNSASQRLCVPLRPLGDSLRPLASCVISRRSMLTLAYMHAQLPTPGVQMRISQTCTCT